jgi:PAS domain S-box-containing protein
MLTVSAKEKKHKDILQAYGYLSFAKEQLGRIRAILNNAFESGLLSNESIYQVKQALYIYNKAISKFKNILYENPSIVAKYKMILKQNSFDDMFKIVDKTINNTDAAISYDASAWFKIATTNIDLHKEVENKLFDELHKSIDAKIKNHQKNIMIISLLLMLILAFLTYFMRTIIKKILYSARVLNEEFENSIVLLEQYKDTVDHSFIVSKTDSKGIIRYVNDAFCKISGYSQEELLGKNHNIIRHPDMPKETFKEMWRIIKGLKKPWVGDIKNLAKDGSSYWMKAYISPILDKEGNVIEYIAMRTDITQLQEEKEHIRDNLGIKNQDFEEARHLANEYEKAIDATWSVIRTDTDNIITYVNRTFEKLSGFTKEELLGKNCSELRSKKHIQKGDCKNILKRLSNKEIVRVEFENIGKDNQPCYMDTTIIPIEDSHSKIIEHLHLMCNITELVKLHQEIEKTQQEIIFKMGEIGESRNKETGNHVKRVARYSKLLALKAGLEEKEVDIIEAASPMHDIGKVAISDEILLKPGSFEPHEWEIMKTHSAIGYKVLSGSERELLKAAAIIAHEHHEKYDGSGYPRGIKGEDIHIYGRIVAIADVFDALGSDRVYKKGWELEKIVKFFKEQRDRSFDPKLINLFLENLDEFLDIKDRYKD